MTNILGLYREAVCSPGCHLENDAAILELVASELAAHGHRVVLASADAAHNRGNDAELVFSMSRSPEGLELLARWARHGTIVVNHPDAVLATTRERLAAAAVGVLALPSAHVVPTARASRRRLDTLPGGDWWIKGGGLYASRREDVQRAAATDLERVLDEFECRGICNAVLQEHVAGREIKFYAVGANGFFYCLDTGTGIEIAAPGAELQSAAIGSGIALGLEVFGGDIVIGDDGRATLIDLNDWPSFAPCREAAAAAIARYLEVRLAAGYAIASPAGSAAPSPA